MTHELETYGLILLFALVAVEGCGIPLPGEASLIAAAVLAGNGRFNIAEVVAVASVAAIAGDNTGYWIARLGGRRWITKIPFAGEAAERFLPRGERFFDRHGPKTVLVARFVAVLRITAPWLAGLSHMPWRRFALFNAAGGTLWAAAVGLAAYYFGRAAVDAVTKYGLYAVAAIIAIAVVGFFGHRLVKKRVQNRHIADGAKSALETPSNE